MATTNRKISFSKKKDESTNKCENITGNKHCVIPREILFLLFPSSNIKPQLFSSKLSNSSNTYHGLFLVFLSSLQLFIWEVNVDIFKPS